MTTVVSSLRNFTNLSTEIVGQSHGRCGHAFSLDIVIRQKFPVTDICQEKNFISAFFNSPEGKEASKSLSTKPEFHFYRQI